MFVAMRSNGSTEQFTFESTQFSLIKGLICVKNRYGYWDIVKGLNSWAVNHPF